MTRAVLWRIHRWIGLALALPMILQALTGLILTGEPFVAFLRDLPPASGLLTEPQNLRDVDAAAVLATARAAVPADLEPRRWRVLPDGVVAVDFAAYGRPQTASQVAVVVGDAAPLWVRQNPDVVYRWVHSMHESLLFGPFGRSVIGWIGIGLLLLALSGIVLWWPPLRRWETGFTVTTAARGWRFQRELHGATGIWLFGLLLLQSVSGIAMAFPQTTRAIFGLPALNLTGGRPADHAAADKNQIDPGRLIIAGLTTAQAAMPTAMLQDLRLPFAPGRPMVAILLQPGDWQGSRRAIVTMDPVTARVLSVQDPATRLPAASILDWLRAFHEGDAAGPTGRLVMCLFALALPIFSITGIAMWTLRCLHRRRRATATSSVMAGRQ